MKGLEVHLTDELRAQASEFLQLLRATDKEKPKPEDLAKLRQHLAARPELGRFLGDLTRLTCKNFIARCFKMAALAESVETYCGLLRTGLGYEQSSQLERMLIDHLVLCWLRLHDAELRYEMLLKESMMLAQGDYWERKVSSSQRRYLRAVEALARVRKLMERSPALQVNIARQQVVTS